MLLDLIKLVITVSVLAIWAYPNTLCACGLDWEVPVNHFDGANARGYVSYSEKIGELDLGGNLKLPLIVTFKSNEQGTSPYFGNGWKLDLVEANVLQTGEGTFVMLQPDGWNNLFRRSDPGSNILNGSAGWKALINNNIITAWAPCGWKIIFNKGKIINLTTPENRRLEFVYSGALVIAIRENGLVKFNIEQDETSRKVKAICFNGKHVVISLDQKPRVENVGGQNVVTGIDQSLKMIMPSDGSTKVFEFAVDKMVDPTLKIIGKDGSERVLVWDPRTKYILEDNGWHYRIKPSEDSNENASIERSNAKGQSELWHYDGIRGEEIVQGIDGVKKTTSWFTQGILAGRLRSIRSCYHGVTTLTQRRFYDENGNLARINPLAGSRKVEYYIDKPPSRTIDPDLTQIVVKSKDGVSFIKVAGEKTVEIKRIGSSILIKPEEIVKNK